jgi:hypothetical protein
MSYEKPIDGVFTARCYAPSAETWRRFIAMVKRKKIGRIEVTSVLEYGDEIAGKMEGVFVAIRLD